MHIPETIIEAIEMMIEKGLFLNFSEAVRTILSNHMLNYNKLAMEVEEMSIDRRHDGGTRKMATSLRLPRSVMLLLEKRAKEQGFASKSELIRYAIVKFLADTSQ
jgi:Arc/MetJ-type ribon-helix-helix transcriptional regulator